MLRLFPMYTKKTNNTQTVETLRDALYQVLCEIPRKLQDCLSLRFGLGQNRRHGIKEISRIFGRSSKKIENMFNRSIRLLRRPCLWKPLSEFLNFADNHVWSCISKKIYPEGSVVSKFFSESFEKKLYCVPGACELLLWIQYGSPTEWVKATSPEAPFSWYRCRYSEKNSKYCTPMFETGNGPF